MRTSQVIETLNLDQEIHRMQTRGGLEKDTALTAASLYRKFLELVVKYPGRVTPSKLIDAAWHEHMADTRKYTADCVKICGTFIHHDPKIMGDEMERRFQDTKGLFMDEFGIDLSQTSKFGHHVAAECGG